MDNPYLQSRLACLGQGLFRMPRDTRPIKQRWQREKSVKIMKSLKGEGAISSLCEPFLTFPDTDFGRDPASVKMLVFCSAGRRIEARYGRASATRSSWKSQRPPAVDKAKAQPYLCRT
jgi:hypothetical protein